jgi:hypothetical protein
MMVLKVSEVAATVVGKPEIFCVDRFLKAVKFLLFVESIITV